MEYDTTEVERTPDPQYKGPTKNVGPEMERRGIACYWGTTLT